MIIHSGGNDVEETTFTEEKKWVNDIIIWSGLQKYCFFGGLEKQLRGSFKFPSAEAPIAPIAVIAVSMLFIFSQVVLDKCKEYNIGARCY